VHLFKIWQRFRDFICEGGIVCLSPSSHFGVLKGIATHLNTSATCFRSQTLENRRPIHTVKLVGEQPMKIKYVLPAKAVSNGLLQQGAKFFRNQIVERVGTKSFISTDLQSLDSQDLFIQAEIDRDDIGRLSLQQTSVLRGSLVGMNDIQFDAWKACLGSIRGIDPATLNFAVDIVVQTNRDSCHANIQCAVDDLGTEIRKRPGGRKAMSVVNLGLR
jgi:hypothetical protein